MKNQRPLRTNMRYNQNAEEALDRRYKQESGSLHRLVLWLFRAHVNKVSKIMLGRAHERGLVDSRTMHELAGIVDHMLWPERR